MTGWVLDKSAVVRTDNPTIGQQLEELAGDLYICPMGQLEQLYSARSAQHYDAEVQRIHSEFQTVEAPSDILERALRLQRDLAHYHGLWHRIPIPDLLIAETALYYGLGVVTADADFERIAHVRPLEVRLLG